MTMMIAVIGACTTPVKYPTMASSTTALSGADGISPDSHSPSPAPTASAGAKMPPGIPLT